MDPHTTWVPDSPSMDHDWNTGPASNFGSGHFAAPEAGSREAEKIFYGLQALVQVRGTSA